MNIAEILKDCPKGTKLYSPIYGEVQLLNINNTSEYPIEIKTDGDRNATFTQDGRIYAYYDGECMLFPSKNNRDWSTFKVHKKKGKYNFKSFDKVPVRDNNSDSWDIDLSSNINDGIGIYKYYVSY